MGQRLKDTVDELWNQKEKWTIKDFESLWSEDFFGGLNGNYCKGLDAFLAQWASAQGAYKDRKSPRFEVATFGKNFAQIKIYTIQKTFDDKDNFHAWDSTITWNED